MLPLTQHRLRVGLGPQLESASPASEEVHGPKPPLRGSPRGVLDVTSSQEISAADSCLEGGADVYDSDSAQSQMDPERGDEAGEMQPGERQGQEAGAPTGQEMTAEQVETLRRQVAVYCGICDNLMALHRAKMSGSQGPLQGLDPYYQDASALSGRSKHRWAPAEAQKVVLERVYAELAGVAPSKARIRELVKELSVHGPLTESNVYNWFQNKKARSKRKSVATEAESSIDDRGAKRMREDGAHSSGSLNVSSFDVDRGSEGGAVTSGLEQRPALPQHLLPPLNWRGNPLAPELAPPPQRSPLFSDTSIHGIHDAAAMLLYAAAESAGQGNVAQTLASNLNLLGAQSETGYYTQAAHAPLERNLGGGLDIPYGGMGSEGSYSQSQQPEASLKVMINGRPYDVPAGPLDVRASFGEGMVLYDSRGMPVLTDNTGVTFDALQDGENYFLHNELQSGTGLGGRAGRHLFS